MKLAHDPIVDPIIQQKVQELHQLQSLETTSLSNWDKDVYTSTFRNWIESSSYNHVLGLDAFKHSCYTAGAVDGIASFIHRHATSRRIRFSAAEFIGNKIVSNHANLKYALLEQEPLEKGDALVLSLPFSGTGSMHKDYFDIIQTCNLYHIPVLIDMAYFSTSYGIDVDLDQPCITDVVFSLSKCFSTSLRLGYRVTKEYHDDISQANYELGICNRWAVNTGVQLLETFSHDWIIERFRPIQLEVCKTLDVTPSNTLTLAIGNEKDHSEFNRNGYIRVCITDELHQNI